VPIYANKGTVDFLSDGHLVKSLTFSTVPEQRKIYILGHLCTIYGNLKNTPDCRVYSSVSVHLVLGFLQEESVQGRI